MTRVVHIVLIAAMLLQATGCAVRPHVISQRADSLAVIPVQFREEAYLRLRKGMRAKIVLRENAPVPLQNRIIEGTIETAGIRSLTILSGAGFSRGGNRERITLRYADIAYIEYVNESPANKKALWVGAGLGGLGGGLMAVLLLAWALSGD